MMVPGSGIAKSILNSHSPSADKPVDQLARHVIDVRCHCLDAARQERLGDQLSVGRGDRRVCALQRRDVAPPRSRRVS
jgi:hypothetical protein